MLVLANSVPSVAVETENNGFKAENINDIKITITTT